MRHRFSIKQAVTHDGQVVYMIHDDKLSRLWETQIPSEHLAGVYANHLDSLQESELRALELTWLPV